MKPITDDVVHSLLQGIAAREKTRRGRDRRASSAPAKIIKFTGPNVRNGKIKIDAEGTRRTISGVFCYVSRLGKA
jgi:hypothetical protein